MESNMVIDNSTTLSPLEAIDLINRYFEIALVKFEKKDCYNNGKFYGYGCTYFYGDIEIHIGGERGCLDYYFSLNGKKIPPKELDTRLLSVFSNSKINHTILFDVLLNKILSLTK